MPKSFYIVVLSLSIFLISIGNPTCRGQHFNLIWPVGEYLGSNPNQMANLNFSSGVLQIDTVTRYSGFTLQNSCITDSIGNIRAYTNGCFIANSLNDTMTNGHGMSTTSCGDDNCAYGNTIVYQGNLLLPDPGNANRFYLFHETCEYSTQLHPWNLFYSIIDMSLQGGLGEVVNRNTDILQDVMDGGILTATKHSNGIDWWIMVHHHDTDEYVRFLLTAQGLQGPYRQHIGPVINNDARGNSKFSPDGLLFATSTFEADLRLFDFDRCTGLLSNYRIYDTPGQVFATGVEFSSNSRFLYLSAQMYIFQFDLLNSPSVLTPTIVAVIDSSFLAPNICYFFTPQLAPDNKIYISSWASSYAMHTIHYPDSPGVACQVQQHSIILPCSNGGTVPNLVNYNLGPLDSTVCDTSVSVQTIYSNSFELEAYPNPTQGQFRLKFSEATEQLLYLELTDIYNRQVYWTKMSNADLTLPELNSGVYFLRVRTQSQHEYLKKIVFDKEK